MKKTVYFTSSLQSVIVYNSGKKATRIMSIFAHKFSLYEVYRKMSHFRNGSNRKHLNINNLYICSYISASAVHIYRSINDPSALKALLPAVVLRSLTPSTSRVDLPGVEVAMVVGVRP